VAEIFSFLPSKIGEEIKRSKSGRRVVVVVVVVAVVVDDVVVKRKVD